MCAARLCNNLLAELTFDNKQVVGTRPYVHHQHKLKQNWCTFIHMKQLRCPHFMTQIVKLCCEVIPSGRAWRNEPHTRCVHRQSWVLTQWILGTHRVTGIGLQKIPCWSANCQFNPISLVCVVCYECDGLSFFGDTINSYHVTHILTPVFNHISDYERTYAFFSGTGGDELYGRNKYRALIVAYELRI
jgi:hypothetical protein